MTNQQNLRGRLLWALNTSVDSRGSPQTPLFGPSWFLEVGGPLLRVYLGPGLLAESGSPPTYDHQAPLLSEVLTLGWCLGGRGEWVSQIPSFFLVLGWRETAKALLFIIFWWCLPYFISPPWDI